MESSEAKGGGGEYISSPSVGFESMWQAQYTIQSTLYLLTFTAAPRQSNQVTVYLYNTIILSRFHTDFDCHISLISQ